MDSHSRCLIVSRTEGSTLCRGFEAVTIERLTNEQWGLETNCFVCEPKNEAGLRIPFFFDDEADEVTAEFTLDGRFSGAPTIVHGGVTLAILDEAMAWATIASRKRFAMTTSTTTNFAGLVQCDTAYRVWAEVSGGDDTQLFTRAEVINPDDSATVATAEATFLVLSEAQISEVAGVDLPDGLEEYLPDRSA